MITDSQIIFQQDTLAHDQVHESVYKYVYVF